MKPQRLVIVAALLAVQTVVGQVPTSSAPWPTKGWQRAEPHSVGLDGKVLAALDAEIAAGKYGYVDSMLVVRNGRLAFDRSYRHDYDRIYAEQARARGPLNPLDPSVCCQPSSRRAERTARCIAAAESRRKRSCSTRTIGCPA